MWNRLILRFMEDVNKRIKRHGNLNLDIVPYEFNSRRVRVSLNFIRLLRVVITPSVTTLLRGENDSKQSDEFQAKFAYIWPEQTKWAGEIATKTERTKIHILSDVFAPIASLDLKVPNIAWSSSESTRKYISSKKYKTILTVNSLTILAYIR